MCWDVHSRKEMHYTLLVICVLDKVSCCITFALSDVRCFVA